MVWARDWVCCFCFNIARFPVLWKQKTKTKIITGSSQIFWHIVLNSASTTGRLTLVTPLYSQVLGEGLLTIPLFSKWCLPPAYPALCTDTNLPWNWLTLLKPGLQERWLHWTILLTGQCMLQSRKIIKNYILRASTFKRLYLGKITVSYLHLSDASALERGPGNITILNENCFLNILSPIRST